MPPSRDTSAPRPSWREATQNERALGPLCAGAAPSLGIRELRRSRSRGASFSDAGCRRCGASLDGMRGSDGCRKPAVRAGGAERSSRPVAFCGVLGSPGRDPNRAPVNHANRRERRW